MRPAKLLVPSLVLALSFCSGCDNAKKKPATASPKPSAQPVATTPKPAGPPQFVVDNIGVKVGYSLILLDKPEGPDKLEKELSGANKYIDGKNVLLKADRKAKTQAVATMITALAKHGAKTVTVKTQTRKEYPGKVEFTPQSEVQSPAPCSVVAMVLKDRSSAVWRLKGTTAIRHSKGLAGPDLSMTGDTIRSHAKSCKKSSTIFISAAKDIEWGLAYDLAASTTKLKKVKFDHVVLLEQVPVAGRKVEL